MYAMEQTYGSYWNPFTWFVTGRDATIEVLRRRQDAKVPISPGTTLSQSAWSDLFGEIRRLWRDEWGKDDVLSPRVVIETLRDYRVTAIGPPVVAPDMTEPDTSSRTGITEPDTSFRTGMMVIGGLILVYVVGAYWRNKK